MTIIVRQYLHKKIKKSNKSLPFSSIAVTQLQTSSIKVIELIFILLAFAFTASTAYADVYRCVVNGKTVYSDSRCEYGASPIKLQDNIIRRTQSDKDRDDQMAYRAGQMALEEKVNDAKSARQYANKCSFSAYALGDDKGKILAAAARDECYKNEILKESGKSDQVSLDAYNLWKDHRIITKRTPPPPPAAALSYHCRPDYMGGMRCDP